MSKIHSFFILSILSFFVVNVSLFAGINLKQTSIKIFLKEHRAFILPG